MAKGKKASEAEIAVHWKEEGLVHPSPEFIAQANMTDPGIYERFALDNFPECFKEYADLLSWDKYWETTLDTSDAPCWKWFVGGLVNACYNCVDRHLPLYKNKAAIHFVPEPEDEPPFALTYQELYVRVNEFALVLRDVCGLKAGDRVTLHMPMVAELPVTMLACARLGIIHSEVFGGFSGEALADRTMNSGSRVLITIDAYHRGGKLLDHKVNADIAVNTAKKLGYKVDKVLIWQRYPGQYNSESPLKKGRDFLVHDGDAKELRVTAGDHTVGRDLVVPIGVTLVIPAGTTLRFAAAAAIVAHGPIRFTGTAEAPVILRPGDDKKGWQGIAVVRAGARSTVQHTRFVHTTGVAKPGWTLTGGVTFYESDVDILAATFKNHDGEDALNIVRSDFTVAKTAFDTTLSDAFDSDFSTGRITDTSFTNIGTAGGGDAVDTSGSTVEISGVTFRKVSDKSISVGEASTVTVRDVTIEDTGTGLASKDRSMLTATKVLIRGARFAPLTAYIKKPEYGGATIIADDISIEGGKQESLVQLGSRIVLAGNEITAQVLDIDALYDTVMKKGAQ